jgi:hypothetical protein
MAKMKDYCRFGAFAFAAAAVDVTKFNRIFCFQHFISRHVSGSLLVPVTGFEPLILGI